MSTEQQQVKTMVLRDLQPLLRRKLGDRLIVESFTTEPLLPPGENYGSTILSVHAVIKKDEDSDKEDLYLIAKMPPPTNFQREIFDSPYTFRKESFMYEEILPLYNKLEIENGIKESEVFDVLPKFYGFRTSLDPDIDFDDNAVILLENLKVRGYYTGNRCKGYDFEHSKFAIRAMARFHALGMTVKYKKPEEFEILKIRSKCLNFKTDGFENILQLLLEKMQEDPVLNQHLSKCEKALTNGTTQDIWTEIPEEPWSTIIHSDFWVNNILFHRDENGRVDDIKFVDFQNYLFFNPLREMIFYLFSSVDQEVHDHHIDYLIDLYHETLTRTLERMGCDVSPFSRDKFNERIPSAAYVEFMHLCFMLKVLTLDAKEVNLGYDKMENIMTSYRGNQAFIDRLRTLVLYFVKHQWI